MRLRCFVLPNRETDMILIRFVVAFWIVVPIVASLFLILTPAVFVINVLAMFVGITKELDFTQRMWDLLYGVAGVFFPTKP